MKKGFLVQIIVGAEYIVCTHWINIVGAAAPLHPWFLRLCVATFNNAVIISCLRENFITSITPFGASNGASERVSLARAKFRRGTSN